MEFLVYDPLSGVDSMRPTDAPSAVRWIVVPVALLALVVILWLAGFVATVMPINSAPTLAAVMEGGVAFDKVAFVNGIWSSKVVPTVDRDAVDLATLVLALRSSPAAAAKRYGNDVGGAYNFLVRFTGTVATEDTASLTGTFTVDAPFGGGVLPVKVQIGPIILGTALRDAVRFITFEQFTNQMQYGDVSDELNTRVTRDVLSKLDLKGLLGKRVSIKGAFTYDGTNAKDLLITPVIVVQAAS